MRRVGNGLTLVLLALCMAAAWMLQVLEQNPDLGLAVGETATPAAEPDGEIPEPVPVPRSVASMRPFVDRDALLERPLFVEGRRPPELPEAETQAPAQTRILAPFEYVLEGLVSRGDAGTALLRTRIGQERHRLNQGQTLDGWTLLRVDPQQAEFGYDQQRLVLELEQPVERGSTPVQWQRLPR